MVLRKGVVSSTAAALFVVAVLAVAATAAASSSAVPPMRRAGYYTFWYVRIHNTLLGQAFGRAPAPRHVKVRVRSGGVLTFNESKRTIAGRISCRPFPTDQPERKMFSCQWKITVKRGDIYSGWALVTIYTTAGFNVESGQSHCRPYVPRGAFCRKYPPPNG